MPLSQRICPRCGATTPEAICGACSVASVPALLDNRFALAHLLHHDELGARFTARETSTDKMVVVRLGRALDANLFGRFRKEVALAKEMTHLNVSRVLDGGIEPEGRPFVVYEWHEGTLLSAEIEKLGRLDVARAMSIATQVLKALHELHSVAAVHDFLQPGAVLLVAAQPREVVKLLDVGFSWLSGLRQTPDAGSADVQADLCAMGALITHMAAGTVDGTGSLSTEVADVVSHLTSENLQERPVSALHAISMLQKLLPAPSDVSNVDILTMGAAEFSLLDAERQARNQMLSSEMSGRLRTNLALPGGGNRWLVLVVGLVVGAALAWFAAMQLR